MVDDDVHYFHFLSYSVLTLPFRNSNNGKLRKQKSFILEMLSGIKFELVIRIFDFSWFFLYFCTNLRVISKNNKKPRCCAVYSPNFDMTSVTFIKGNMLSLFKINKDNVTTEIPQEHNKSSFLFYYSFHRCLIIFLRDRFI